MTLQLESHSNAYSHSRNNALFLLNAKFVALRQHHSYYRVVNLFQFIRILEKS